ncbi:triosephosphate isomerase [Ferroplasma acidiphilum]|uniref:Triosephosphate isomerase n=1 Tax=Ferroplasma acidiphilum TaxID=74969 RepID=A0A1V0N1L3_9ARCH|nr:triose-phosphate isomerase [Ferroplasma acidiphilum]ARD84040.1 triosephosphate isomerase [Ferroplasma acidiphilum]
MEPEIFINFKHYNNAVGTNSEKLLADFKSIKNQDSLYYCVAETDLYLQKSFPELHIYGQHVDSNGYGAFTGSVSMESLLDLGVKGSLLNHSEKRVDSSIIESIVKKSKELGFKIILCVENLDEAEKYSKLEPAYIAYEPPELIGGDISVSTARPEIIGQAAEICKGRTKLLVGAGVKTKEDVDTSMALGAAGVLIASGIIKNAKPINRLVSLMGNR